MKKRLFVLLALIGVTFRVAAFDFEVRHAGGFSLYYNIVDDDDAVVELTYPGASGSYWLGFPQPSGTLVIDATVTHGGVKYTVVGVGDRAFSGCSALTGVRFPASLTDIGAYAFYQTGLEGELVIPEGVVNIGRNAFYGCNAITVLRFNAVACEVMGGSRSTIAFGGCRSLSRIVFGPKVRFIPAYAFTGMDLLIMDWELPRSLEAVGDYAFAYCFSIAGNLRLPESVRRVGAGAFAQCHSLFQVDLPAGLDQIGNRAFYQCINLRRVKCDALVPPAIDDNVFDGVPATLTVPCFGAKGYSEAKGWSRLRLATSTQPCVLPLRASASSDGGSVLGTGTYRIGDTARLVAVCRAGYSFLGWSDGNRDNPRLVVVSDTVSFRAIIQPTEVVHEVEHIHDTIYEDGVEVVYEYVEIGDIAEPLDSQSAITYNAERRRIEIPFDNRDIVSVALYNDAGLCVSTGIPRHGHIRMRRFPSGFYIVRVTTFDRDLALRFFHNKTR